LAKRKARSQPRLARLRFLLRLFRLFAAIWGVSRTMFRWLLLPFALVALGLGLLTQVRSPEWSPWKLALLAGEFGHWLALLPVVTGVLAWRWRMEAPTPATVCMLLSALAVGLLLTPALGAWKIGGGLPGRLTRQFGATPLAREPFSLAGLFRARPAAVAAETLVFSPEHALSLDFYRAVGRTTPARA
jgi:hypothetical protein